MKYTKYFALLLAISAANYQINGMTLSTIAVGKLLKPKIEELLWRYTIKNIDLSTVAGRQQWQAQMCLAIDDTHLAHIDYLKWYFLQQYSYGEGLFEYYGEIFKAVRHALQINRTVTARYLVGPAYVARDMLFCLVDWLTKIEPDVAGIKFLLEDMNAIKLLDKQLFKQLLTASRQENQAVVSYLTQVYEQKFS